MLKLIKEKMLVSLVLVMLAIMVFGSVSSLATVIRPTTDTNTANTAVDNTVGAASTNTANNTNTNKANAISSSVSAVNNTANTSKYNKTNTNTNTNTNKAATKLPYAGSNTSMVFVVIALTASAVYAYKKVSDYNI